MRRELTDPWLRGVKPPAGGRLEIWDLRVSGLVLRITPSGAATWSVRARTTEGKRTRAKLGTWPALDIAEARRRALGVTADIQGGGDPVAARKAAKADRAARAGLPTVAARLDEWQAARVGDRVKPWSDIYAAEVRRLGSREIVPTLGKRPLVETTRADWTELVARKRNTAPAMASLLYRVCAAFLGHAEAHGWIAAPLLPRKGLAALAAPPAARARILSDAELRAIWTAAKGLTPKARAFVHILAMTACRENEAANIAVGEINRETGRWSIPGIRTKNKQSIILPLHPLLLADLQAIWPTHDPVAPGFRLLGAITGSGFRGFSKLKARLDAASGVTDWRWHDLRRTARTGMTRLGVPRDHAEAGLNHISGRSALERTYDRHDFAAEVISALETWQVHVEALVAAPLSAEIIPLRARQS